MIYVNNFRYGKISKRMAGRFDAEQYNQGAFTFRNVKAMFEGGATRRPPLRHLFSVSTKVTSYLNANGDERLTQEAGYTTARESYVKIYVTKGFTISSTVSYLIGIGTRSWTGHSGNESVFVYYRFRNNQFELAGIGSLAKAVVTSTSKGAEETPVLLSEDDCDKLCFAQYYDRMYVASHYFKTFYFRYNGSGIVAELKPFIFYNDAKGKMKMVKEDSNRSDAGKIIFAHDEGNGTKYYYNTMYLAKDEAVGITPNDIKDATDAYVTGFNDYSDNEFNHCSQNYPSIVAVINDCLWMANTINNPNAIWKSRVLGSSQWIEGYDADTLHDFSPFQVVSTEAYVLKDVDEWELASMRDSNGQFMYQQYGGSDIWYITRDAGGASYDLNPKNKRNPYPDKDNLQYYLDTEGEIYYKYDNAHRLVRVAKPHVQYGAGKVYSFSEWYSDKDLTKIEPDVDKWFYEWDKDGVKGKSYSKSVTLNLQWTSKDNSPRFYTALLNEKGEIDTSASSYTHGLITNGNYWYDGTYYRLVGTPRDAIGLDDYGLEHWWDNYDWYYYQKNGQTYDYQHSDRNVNLKVTLTEAPVRQKYESYDMSTNAKLYSNDLKIDVVATDSCSIRMELNTGKEDAIRFIKSGCDKIIIGTTNAEWTLPAGFNAVSNNSASRYSGYGSLEHEPIELNRSLIFLQRGKLLREFYLYQSYLMQRDVTAMNHDAVGYASVIDTIAKNAPDPTLYIVRDDGTILYGMYEADEGLDSFADWDIGDSTFRFKNVSVIERGDEEVVVTLVNKKDVDGNTVAQYLCLFDEHEQDKPYADQDWADQIEGSSDHKDYESEIETSYIEINNQAIMFGRNKKTKGVWIRPYESGRIQVGNDRRQLTLTNYSLGNVDYHAPVTGKADMAFSMWLKSYRNEPMNILAFAWEVEQ